MKLYTIGHSVAELPELIDALRAHDIDVLVDVRSKPRSRMQHFDLGPLEAALEDAGIRYRFLGDRLGGMPRDPEIAERWRQGRLDAIVVAHLRSTDEWQDGLAELARLVGAADEPTVCIMCSEANPDECHRKAVALDMTEVLTGLTVEHLSIRKSAPSEVGVQEVLL
jgi:uncharacterized protein (DUF488 family)